MKKEEFALGSGKLNGTHAAQDVLFADMPSTVLLIFFRSCDESEKKHKIST